MLSSNTTEERFNSTRRTEGRNLYLTKIISDIGELSHLIDCHGVCGNNNEVSFVTNLLVELGFGKKMQCFMCLVVSSSRLLFTFHVFSFKWVLISILNTQAEQPGFKFRLSFLFSPRSVHSRPQSLRSFWPAAGIERL